MSKMEFYMRKVLILVFILMFFLSCSNPFEGKNEKKIIKHYTKIVKVIKIKDLGENIKENSYPAQISLFHQYNGF